LDHWHVAVRLSAGPIHGGEPAWRRVMDPGRRYQRLLGLLDAPGTVIQQHLACVPPEPLVKVAAEVLAPTLTPLAHLARLLAEAEDPPETGRFDHTPPGVAQDDLW